MRTTESAHATERVVPTYSTAVEKVGSGLAVLGPPALTIARIIADVPSRRMGPGRTRIHTPKCGLPSVSKLPLMAQLARCFVGGHVAKCDFSASVVVVVNQVSPESKSANS